MALIDISDDLGPRLRAHRIGLHLSQREAADRLGISERTLQNWEAGTTFPWPKHRRALERFFRERSVAEDGE
jgi:transcriptional regulator with XRE-family HTH domain